MSLYDDLGANPDDTYDELHAAFRKKAHETHPDKGGDPAKFQIVQRAWAVLRDHRKRRAYDQGGVPPPDQNIPAQALLNICSLVLQISDRLDVDNSDMRQALIVEIRENIRKRNELVLQARNRMSVRRRIAKRWKKKTPGDNVIAKMFEREAENQQATIDRLEEEIAVGAAMMEIVKDYSYDFEPTITAGDFSGFLGSTGGGFGRR